MTESVSYKTPAEACEALEHLYEVERARILEAYGKSLQGEWPVSRVHGYYPQISVKIEELPEEIDSSQAYGYCTQKGIYSSTFTRPDLFGNYLLTQLKILKSNHPEIEFEVGLGTEPMPLAYLLDERFDIKGEISEQDAPRIKRFFDVPEPQYFINEPRNQPCRQPHYPLAWYNGPRTDRSLNFLRHYTGTNPQHFQPYILFTNYQDYVDAFLKEAHSRLEQKPQEGEEPWIALVRPGNLIKINPHIDGLEKIFNIEAGKKRKRLPQMPAYHMVRQDGLGVTIVNIGVGPSNAKTITDHIATLRPELFMMVGHCAGLNASQKMGDYVIANGYVFEDGLMEDVMGTNISIPELSEVHRAIKTAASEVLDLSDEAEFKRAVRTGVVTTTADRNWEAPETWAKYEDLIKRLGQNRSLALDMESAVIAANGFRHHVPYGSLLCVSDKPLSGEPKLPGIAQGFYRERVQQQFNIAMRAIEHVKETRESLQSRKLRSDLEHVPFM